MLHRITDQFKKKVIVVDDDTFFAKLLKNYLNKSHINAEVLSDGNALIEYLQNNTADLIVLDLIMPQLDGFDTIEKIKLHNLFDLSKIIVVTSLSQNEDRQTVKKYGIREYVVKGEVTIQELSDLLNKYL